jgi:hypothetical protein
MFLNNQSTIVLQKPTLNFLSIRALVFQIILILTAVVLPAVSHSTGAPVRYLLPMHWAVILAGLIYGWRGGILVGLLSPFISFFFSGMPLLNILPSMTVELITYGFVTGLLREAFQLNSFLSVAIALVFGRIVFVASILFLNVVTMNQIEYFKVALLPGVIAAFLQILLLPFIAHWWLKNERKNTKE